MARGEEGMSFWQSVVDFLKSRVRQKDVFIAVPIGAAYGLALAVSLRVIHRQFSTVGASADVGWSYYLPPSILGFAVTAGILLAWLFAFTQVDDEEGIPHGLTPQAALKPVAFMAVISLVSVPRLVENYGYGYAAATVLAMCLNTLWVSFLLRWWRLKL